MVVLLFLRCFRTPGGLVEQPPLAVPGAQSKALKEQGGGRKILTLLIGEECNTTILSTLTEFERAQRRGRG